MLGRDENYDVLFDSALEAIREHPGTYVRGVADAFWEFLMQQPLREDVVPRAQTGSGAARADVRERTASCCRTRRRTVLVDGVPYGFVWCASDYIDSCTLDRPVSSSGTTRRRRSATARSSSQVRAWDADLPSRDGRRLASRRS